MRLRLAASSLLACIVAASCSRDEPSSLVEPPPSAVVIGKAPPSPPTPASSPSQQAAAPRPADQPATPPSSQAAPFVPPVESARPLAMSTQDELLAMFTVRTFSEKEKKRRGDPDLFLRKNIGPDVPYRSNQGNQAIAKHDVTREQCLAGLTGMTLQTPEQRQICGADNMVPVYKHGDPKKARVCIDIFEFPNKPCELPFVWIGPTQAATVCELQGKRLCSQEEWVLACRGDPEGKEDWLYAYGNDLDLTVCNTNKPAASYGEPRCDPDTTSSTWKTCHSNTEPTGSFPRCRSRFGVFDMHGNVAEIMTRWDPEGTMSQLKGSAFFYVDVARKHNERQKENSRETYADHCAHDPRWHVEPMTMAWHVNYHLGFRCCKSIK